MPLRLIEVASTGAIAQKRYTTASRQAAGDLLTVNAALGLRTTEGYGLYGSDLRLRGDFGAHVRRNRTRSLKTFERKIPVALVTRSQRDRLVARLPISKRGHRNDDVPLFRDPKYEGVLFNHGELTSTASRAIKEATGDPLAIPYSVRHTFATAVLSRLLMKEGRASAIAMRIAKELWDPTFDAQILERCRPGPNIFPFQVDRVALWLGQKSVDTLLTTYWHGAWWIQGEYAARLAVASPWNSKTVGALLGLDSSAVRHRMRKLASSMSDVERPLAVVPLYVAGSGVKSLVRSAGSTTSEPEVPTPAVPTPDVSVAPLDAESMLLARRHRGGDFGDLAAALAIETGVPQASIVAFFEGYQQVASVTQMHDFEPDGERATAGTFGGVDKGQEKRRILLARIAERASIDPQFVASTASVVRDWSESVQGSSPVLVSRSLEQLSVHRAWVESLGYRSEHIQVRTFSCAEADVISVRGWPVKHASSKGRLARHTKVGTRGEFGLEIKEASSMPNGREFQRVMFALACQLAADPKVS